MAGIRTLVVTSCTGEKKYKPANQLVQDDFRNPLRLAKREEELKEYRLPAGLMYTGMQHLRLMDGIAILRKTYGHDFVDLCIVSAGYGLLDEETEIVPYELTFITMDRPQIREWSNHLKIKESLTKRIRGYDLVFFLLGTDYVRSLDLPIIVETNTKLVFLASKTSKKLVPSYAPYHFIDVGMDEAKSFSYGLVGLKGYLFKLLAREVAERGKDLLLEVHESPSSLMEWLKHHKNARSNQLELFPEHSCQCLGLNEDGPKTEEENIKIEFNYSVPDESIAQNYGLPIQYYIPECDDRVDPEYDFIKDETASRRKDLHSHDVYAHQIYTEPNYDGVLVSKTNVEDSPRKKEKILELGVHEYIRFPKNRPMMGDCGAFSYIAEFEPPYETQEILDYYQQLGFDYGVSIDHLIVGKFAKDPLIRKWRFNLTRDNAEYFLRKWNEGHQAGLYTFTPIGVAQGWDPRSYRESVADLIAMGYEYIALGGLARATSPQIFEVMKKISSVIPEHLRVHLFGVARPEHLHTFRKLGMTSFDSASYLRRAWLSNKSNYFIDDDTYAAIRVPQVNGRSRKIELLIDEGIATREELKIMEQAALTALRKYDQYLIGIEETLEVVLAYDDLIDEDRERNIELYQRTLEDRPWKRCGCKICRELGIEVIIFRGNNRNRRRGFHNTYVFYKKFKELFF